MPGAAERALELRRQRERGQPPLGSTVTGPSGVPELGAPHPSVAERALLMRDRRDRSLTDDEFAARFVGQETVQGEPLGGWDRMWMSALADTPSERQAFVEKWMPPGTELIEVPDTGIALYRRGPDEPYRKVDPGFFEIAGQGALKAAAESGRDVGEFLTGDAGQLIGEAVISTRFPGGGRGIGFLTRLALGAAGGEIVQEGVQAAAGTQRQTLGEVGTSAAIEGGMSFIGGSLGAAITGAANIGLRGRGLVGSMQGAEEAIEAAERLGVEAPLTSQLSDVPFVRRLSRQASSVLPFLRRQEQRAAQQTLARVRAELDPAARRAFMEEAVKAADTDRRAVLDLVQKEIRYSRKDPRATAEAVKPHFDAWWKRSGQRVDEAYSVARSIDEPEFDLEPALEYARQLAEGVQAAGHRRTIRHPDGSTEEIVPKIRLDRLSTGVRDAVRKLLALDPELPDVEGARAISRTDRLRALIKLLRDESLPGPEGPRESNIVAGKLRGVLQSVLENPTNSDPEFVAAWLKANRMAFDRFETRETMAVLEMVKAFEGKRPGGWINGLLHPSNRNLVDDLIAVRQATSPEAFREIRQAALTRVLRDPSRIAEELAEYDQQALRILFPKGVRESLDKAATSLKRLTQTNIEAVAERQDRVGAYIRAIVDTRDTASVSALKELIGRSQSIAFQRSARSAIIDEIVRRSTIVRDNAERFSGAKLRETLADFSERGLLDLIDPNTQAVLRDARALAAIQDISIEDPGTALRGASIISGAAQFALASIVDLVHLYGVGKILQNPKLRGIIVGKGGRDAFEGTVLKTLASAAGLLAVDLEAEADAPGYAAAERLRQGLVASSPVLSAVEGLQ